jgi:hypothetical protein
MMTKNDQLYSQLLYLLHHNAYTALEQIDEQQLHDAEVKNVRQLIDMVAMLKEKTNGNLSSDLDQIQSMMLSELEAKYDQKITKFKFDESARK